MTRRQQKSRRPQKIFPKKKTQIRYKKERQINSGSYGKVFIAWDTREQRKVVIKQVEIDYYVELLKEIHFMRGLHLQAPHYFPNILQVIHDGDQKLLLMVMDYYPWTLNDLMEHDPDNIYLMSIFQQLMEAYVIMESNLIAHFDLKPDNILIHWPEDSDLPVIKIIDLGFSEYYSQQARASFVCTDYYRPPEIFGEADKIYGCEVDLWSIGVILNEYFQKIHVFRGEKESDVLVDIHQKMSNMDFKRFWEWHPDLGFIIQSLLNYRIDRRLQAYRYLRPFIYDNLQDRGIFTPNGYESIHPEAESELIHPEAESELIHPEAESELIQSETESELRKRYQIIEPVEPRIDTLSDIVIESLEASTSVSPPETSTSVNPPETSTSVSPPETSTSVSPPETSTSVSPPETSPEPIEEFPEDILEGTNESTILKWMTEGEPENEIEGEPENEIEGEPENEIAGETENEIENEIEVKRQPETSIAKVESVYYYNLLFPLPTIEMIKSDYSNIKALGRLPRANWYNVLKNSLDVIEALEEPDNSSVAWSAFYRIIIRYLTSLNHQIPQADLQLAVTTSLYMVSQIYYYRPLRLRDFMEISQVYLGWRFKSHSVDNHQMRMVKFI